MNTTEYLLESSGVKKFYYNLNDKKPIEVLVNHHKKEDDAWFDMHYEVELGIVVSGKMKRCFLDHEIVLEAGGVWMHGMWEPHGFEILEAPCVVVVFEIFPELLLQENSRWLDLFLIDPKNRPLVSKAVSEEIQRISKRILQITLTKSAYHQDWVRVLIFEVLLNMMEITPEHLLSIGSSSNSVTYYGIQPALHLVFREKRLVTLEEAAHVCGRSRNTFSKDFKSLMGISFAKFALNYRLRGALHQLKNTSNTLDKVASDWGFSDASHLYKLTKGVKESTSAD